MILLFTVSVVIFFNWYSKIIERLEYRLQQIKSDFVINHIKVTFEYLTPDGSLTSYRRDDHITNIKGKKMLETNVEVEGEILKDKVSGINTAFSFRGKNRITTHHQTKNENIARGGEYYSSY
ncbi:MAG TPA: hypothetical protein DCE81_12630 [Cytophagales bacterium]|nr:hypothetical protein [Cytophagales bacterium]